MAGSSDGVIERTRVCEVAGVFRSCEALDAAAADLLQAEFDRADIDVIGDLRAVRERLGGGYVAPEALPKRPDVPRRPYVRREDIAVAASVITGSLAAAGAMAVAFGIAVSGGRVALAIGAAAVAALAIGAVASAVLARYFGRRPLPGMEWLVPERGIIVWVRVRTPEQERAAQDILRRHSAEAVRVQEIEIDKRTENLPLASLRPDPWLGNERLGEP